MVSIKIKNLTKRFGKVTAVNNLEMNIKDKEFIALLGPSGCGKTTTLRCIAGLEKPDEGKIYFGNREMSDVLPVDRNIAMVFQSYALFPHMKVFDNIAFPLKIKKRPKQEIEKKVKQVAESLRIPELLDRKPSQLSGGQAQRVALGRALIGGPDVFLLDEPLASLDAKLRLSMRSELKKLQEEVGITTIFVTHDQLEAMCLADRVVVMENGCSRRFGTPHEIYNNPKHVSVAGFVGSPPANLLEGDIVEKKGNLFIDCGFFDLRIPDYLKEPLMKHTSSEVVVGIRPEYISIGKDFEKLERINGVIYTIETLGSQRLITVRNDDSFMKIITGDDFTQSSGEKISLGFDMQKAYIFDKKTGESII